MARLKLAVCISGFLSKKINFSNFIDSLESFKKSFPDDKFEKYYFIAVDSDECNHVKEYINYVNPCDYTDFEKLVLPNFNLSIINKRPETNLLNTYLMFWRIKLCDELRVSHEIKNEFKFDFVIRMRPDLNFFKKIPNFIILAIKLNIINFYIPYFPWKLKYAVTDFFAFGTSKKMTYYSKAYEKLEEYILEGIVFHPELLLGYHLKKKFFTFDFFITICGLYGSQSRFRLHGYRR